MPTPPVIQATQQPASLDMTYGPNILTLSNLGAADKYVVKILNQADNSVIAEVRQSANSAGNAIFDIQKILQSYIGPSKGGIESLGQGIYNLSLSNSANETFRYVIQIGSETSGVVTMASLSPKETLGGIKQYYDQYFSFGSYNGSVSGDDSNPPCSVAGNTQGAPLSDWTQFVEYSDITDGKPSGQNATDRIQVREVRKSDHFTSTWYNNISINNPAPASEVTGIEGFRIITYQGNTQLQYEIIPNIQDNGGGPNMSYGDGTVVNHPFSFITMGTGPQNLQYNQYTDGIRSEVFQLSPLATHYYVTPVLYTPGSCIATKVGYAERSSWQTQRFNIVDKQCLDYDEIEFSWLNSYGFRDYWTFTKRNNKTIRNRKNNFDKSNIDYAAAEWDVDTYSRGTTTYSQELMQEFTAFTDYMTDDEAKYIEGIFTSPDVRVKLGTAYSPVGYDLSWWGATILSNTYTEKSYRKNKLFQYDVRFKLANQLKTQRG